MKIKHEGVLVDVSYKDCAERRCFWPRPDPGTFQQGRGYSERSGGNKGWLCGEREARGCPENKEELLDELTS